MPTGVAVYKRFGAHGSSLRRFRFFFYSNEAQEPAHVHVSRQDDQAKFWLSPVRLAWSDGFNAATLNRLHGIVREKEAMFLEKWNEYFSR